MLKIVYGIALGQLLAALLVIALQLVLTVAFWSLAEVCWRSLIRGLDQVTAGLFNLSCRFRRPTC